MTEIAPKIVATNEADVNRDPIFNTTGAHPVGTGAGAASGGVAAATVGLVMGGPVGGTIGAAVGKVAGGVAEKSAAETINPKAQEAFWRKTYIHEPYYVAGRAYEYYAPGFRTGWEGRVRHDGRTFEQAEPELKSAYKLAQSGIGSGWQNVRPAARAAWNRVDLYWQVGR